MTGRETKTKLLRPRPPTPESPDPHKFIECSIVSDGILKRSEVSTFPPTSSIATPYRLQDAE